MTPAKTATALIVAARLAGTDGVSLESDKLADGLRRRGWRVVQAAGELDGPGHPLPHAHLHEPVASELHDRFFGPAAREEDDRALAHAISARAEPIRNALERIVDRERPHLLVVQNAWAIPMQLPLAVALAELVADRGLPTLSHEHDYYWERERFAKPRLPAWLDRYFPYHAAHVVHLAINQDAAEALHRRRGIRARVLPNVMDFDHPFGDPSRRNDVRTALNLPTSARLFLQPTRVVPRKGIEHAIELLHKLRDPRALLVVSHHAGDEGLATLHSLEAQAQRAGVTMRYLPDRIAVHANATHETGRVPLADLYAASDFVTYPSSYEGFGNALLETIAARKPAMVQRYPVYQRDIAPTGVRFVEFTGAIDDGTVAAVQKRLEDRELVQAEVDHNHRVARDHFGLPRLHRELDASLRALGLAA